MEGVPLVLSNSLAVFLCYVYFFKPLKPIGTGGMLH